MPIPSVSLLSGRGWLAAAALCAAWTPVAHAQWAVVDVPATIQLVQEVLTAIQQLETMKSQLQQAEQTLQSMSGGRGMAALLGGTNRNYLPTNWNQLSGLPAGGTGYGALTGSLQNQISANAVLSPEQIANLAPADQQQIAAARQWAATNQVVAQTALSNASDRFAEMQSLIDAIPTATDQKGILDLQARISAELGMLQAEQTKLQVLAQTIQAQQASGSQQQREQVLAGHGRFETRFQPTPTAP
jgi:type IV secretion system protein VirB5